MTRHVKHAALLAASMLCTAVVGGCERESEQADEESAGARDEQRASRTRGADDAVSPREIEPVQPLPLHAEMQIDRSKVELGRRLFFDTRLSGDGTLSCASCHRLEHGGAEPERVSTGIRGQRGPINAPTVLNSGYQFRQFWDGRAADLREQAGGPITNPIEMGSTWERALEVVRGDPTYRQLFGAAYPQGIDEASVRDAIAEYERSLVTPAPFDDYLRGNRHAIDERARRGYEQFKSIGCVACHNGILLGGTSFQKLGVVRSYFEDRGNVTHADLGRYNVTLRESDRHLFKVPTLRNVEQTAPYFHDGTRATLADAVQAMGHYQLGRDLTETETNDVVAFLRTLTGELPEWAHPPEGEVRAPEPAERRRN